MLVFWRRRAATQRWLRLALGGVVLIAVLGTTVVVGLAARQPDIAVRSALRSASADDGSMVWERDAAGDVRAAAVQDAATRSELRRTMGGAPVTIDATATGDPLRVAGRALAVLPLQGDAALRAAASGIPALRPGQVALDDAGARALGLTAGDTLRLRTDAGERALTVAAVWQARDARAPIWNGIGPGADGTVARAVLAPSELAADRVDLIARWSVAPDPVRVRAADLPRIEAGYSRLAERASGSTSFARIEGGGAATVMGMREGADAAAAIVPVPIALLGAGSLLALLLLVRLLAEVRTEETALLRARGAARGQLAAGDLRGALLPVLGGAAVGWLAAQALLLPVAPPAGWIELLLPVVLPAGAALLVVVAASSLAATPDHAGSARGGRVTAVAGVVLLAMLAVVGVVRLVGAGVGADPAAELAPALVIAALVVAGLLVGAPLAAAWDAVARRRDGVAVPLAARRLRRRPALVAGALVLVALAVASSGFAAATVASSSGFLRDAGRLVTGADLDVEAPGVTSVQSGAPSPDVERLARTARATGSAPALVDEVDIGDLAATLTAAPVVRLAALQDRGLADLAALRGIAGPAVGIPLPAARSVRLVVDARAAAPADARVDLTAWFVRPDGAAVRVDLPGVRVSPPDGRAAVDPVEARLPGAAAWRLVALDAAAQSSGPIEGLTVSVATVTRVGDHGAIGVPLPSAGWRLVAADGAPRGTTATGPLGWAVSGVVDAGGGRAELGRLMPAGSPVVPAAVSRPLASAAGLQAGDRATLDAGVTGIPVRIEAVVPHTIGAAGPSGVFVDLPTLQVAQLRGGGDLPRPDHAWLAVTDATAAATRVAASDPGLVATPAPEATIGRLALPATVASLTAAAGTVLFALLAVATAIAALLRARRAEVAVLRAIGAGSRTQRLAARIELLTVLGYAVLVGALAAVVAVVLTVPQLAHAAAPGVGAEVAAPIAVDPIVLGAAALAVLLGAIGGSVVQETVVRRFAERPRSAEVER